MNDIKLIVGLGNPGEEYAKTRHNVGFMALDKLQKKLDFETFHEEKKFNTAVSIGNFEGHKLILAKPLTFMNLSGNAIAKITSFYKIPQGNCLVIYDDIEIIFGNIRIRKNGSPGTHNGMKSITEALGENFPRLRVGIENRNPDAIQQQDISSYVLTFFTKEEKKILQQTLQKTTDAIITWLTEGPDKAMNDYNNLDFVTK